MPDVPQALDHIRECLKIDPDHKLCFAFYKVAKKLNKQMEAAKKKLLNEEYEEALGKVDACFGTTENHEALLKNVVEFSEKKISLPFFQMLIFRCKKP